MTKCLPFFLASLLLGCFASFAQVPTIASFTPTSGPIGTAVNITGSNFSATPANNIVFFGATKAIVNAATATSLTVTVPTGATYQPITVLTNGLLAYSNAPFVVTFIGGPGIDATSFAAKVDITTGTDPFSVAIGDLDGDGKADLAVANLNSNTVSVIRNTGSVGIISYAAKQDFTTGTRPFSVSIGDLDGDGKADLAVANGASNTVSVFRNLGSVGSISYAAKQDFTTGTGPISVSIGDLDGDGKADLAVANEQTGVNTISVFRNTSSIGSISFEAKVDFTTGTQPVSVSIGDLDGDGKPDLAVANGNNFSSTISVFRNTGSAGSISYAAKVDFIAGFGPKSVSIGDLDGDGKADLAVVVNANGTTVSVLRNTSSIGSISYAAKVDFTTGETPQTVSIGDLDGDGKADLAVTNYLSTSVSVLRNTSSIGNISYAPKVDFTTGELPFSVSVGDLDGDGKSDLAVANFQTGANTISVFRNTVGTAPTITNFTPTSGAVGTSVTITGINFNGATAISFGGTAATSFNVVSATSITAIVSSGTSGSVSVTTPEGTATLAGFAFVPAPTITSFTPTSAGNGTTVTLTGTNLTGATAVSFGGTAATSFNVVSATSITAIVASGTSGSVIVTTPGGTATRTGFTFIPAPTITNFTPTSAGSGTTLTLTGTNLTGATVVSFGGTAATSFNLVSATSITAIVASGTSGSISVTTSGGIATLAGFTFIPAPTITSFTPTSGAVAVTVTITGTNFSTTAANNIVKFNGTVATITGATTSTSIVAAVPTGATTGKITVEVAGQSGTSLDNFLVLAQEPAAQASNLSFGTITTAAMNGSFTAASGSPTGYIVLRNTVVVTDIPADGTTYTGGNTVGLSTVVSLGSSSSFASSGLLAGTVYHYAVFSYNGSGQSLNYLTTNPLIGNKITLPAVPLAQNVTGQTSNFFKATWAAVPSAIGYELDVSFSTSFAPGSFVEGFNNKNVGNTLEQDLNGLLPDTFYYFRVRAVNGSGSSASSNSVSVKTLVGTGGALLTITPPTFANTPTATISVTVSGGSGTKTVKFYSRKISQDAWNAPVDLTSTTSSYSTTITPALLDELGIEFYFTAQDASTATPKRSPENGNAYIYVPLSANEKSIPNLSFGGQVSNYRIISVPYDLTDNLVQSIFGVLGEVDKARWRLIQYQPATQKNVDYPAFNRIEHGKGYWFNSLESVQLTLGAGTTPKFNQQNAFTINLAAGWNQIGAPYPFDIDWDDVQAANAGKPVGKLQVFNPSSSTLGESNNLKVWSGGFVFADAAVSNFTYPVTLKNTAGGRKGKTNEIEAALDATEWFVPLTLAHGAAANTGIGFGMHPQASESKDSFDEIAVPRFFNHLEMSTHHPEFFAPNFARDIVPSAAIHTWHFTVSSSFQPGKASLSWNPETFGNNQAQLILYDETSQTFLDMRSANFYEFEWKEDRVFRLIYSFEKGWNPGFTLLGKPFPNPSATRVTIPIVMMESAGVSIDVIDLTGRKVKSLLVQELPAGVHAIDWTCEDESATRVPGGIYLIQMKTGNSFRQVQKVMVE